MTMIMQLSYLWKYRFVSHLVVTRPLLYQLQTFTSKPVRMNISSALMRSQCIWKRSHLPQLCVFSRNSMLFNTYTGENCLRNFTSPYKVSRDFSRDILVFSYENKKMFRYLTIFGVIQFLLWVNLSNFFYEFFSAADRKNSPREREKTWWKRLMALQSKYKYSSAIFCMMIASIALFASWIYPLRTVHKLTLLAGGQRLRVTTYYQFGMTKDMNIPLEHISFNSSRQHRKNSTLSARIKGKWLYYMLDTRAGKFHNSEIFDHVVGLERKF